jgi:hypothetical protein
MPSKPDPSDGSYSPNQKARLSDDPGDGGRHSFVAEKDGKGDGPEAKNFQSEGQGQDRLAELGRRGSRQS